MNLFGMIDESGGAMQAERMRAEVVAANMANAETTRTAAGSPYRRQSVVFAAGAGDSSFASQFGSSISNFAGGVLSSTGNVARPIFFRSRSTRAIAGRYCASRPKPVLHP